MGINDIRFSDYKELFSYEGIITLLHSEFFVKGSHGNGGPIIIYKDGIWHTFINISQEKDCLKKGLQLFSDYDRYTKFSEDFRTYMQHIRDSVSIKYEKVPSKIDKREIVQLIKDLAKFWGFYGFTEYFYTDLAFQEYKKTKDPVLGKNIRDFEKLKFEGREMLNILTFEDGIIHNILTCISRLFLVHDDDAKYLFSGEIFDLYNNKIPSRKDILERKHIYALARIKKEIIYFTSQEAGTLSNKLIKSNSGTELRGQIANKGMASGRATVLPMMTDPKRIKECAAKMKDGDILIAQSTTPDIMALCKKAKAIVTDQGGMLSHAAIISRELNIPCIVGTLHATKMFKNGDEIEVDANNGIVRLKS